ncbi:MAG: FAD:protein FMN transferase [Acidimicrobiales bacterium]
MTVLVEEAPHEARGRAMGSSMQLLATGPQASAQRALEQAAAMVADLEARWSRFLPTSEISQLNAAPAFTPVAVSAPTIELVARGVEAWRRTAGAFDPTMLLLTIDAGYDRSFEQLSGPTNPAERSELPSTTIVVDTGLAASSRCGEIMVDRKAGTVTLPADCGFDPGGLGKGLAADLIAEAMLGWGADGALVNLGGDLRCLGRAPSPGWWTVALPDESAADGRRQVQLVDGGVATSTCRRRRWTTATGQARHQTHHLIDPSLRGASTAAAHAVTVVAASACDAETVATALAAAESPSLEPRSLGGAAVLLTTSDGSTSGHNGIDRYLR